MTTVAVLPRQPRRLGPRGAALLDLAVVGGIGFLAFVGGVSLSSVVALGLGAAQTLPLLWRRHHPVATFAAVVAASALQVPLLGDPLPSQLAFPVAVYSVARFSSARAGYAALATGLVAAVVAALDWTMAYGDGLVAARSYAVTIGLIVLAAWALGTLGRTRAAYVDALLAHTQHLARDAEQRAELAASDERARIAREMHDVVAHGLSVIVVQADGARYAAAKDPDVATRTLETIAGTGREALTEMRRLLGLLRSDRTGTAP
ncbi:hypothetical protein INN71_10740 [Nocardioides sp. ChNu-153]|uniref:sensor histidine kinase n=1 Tax=unclassified Nocardioides TaxID=2615069 RepID=UPI0024076262|nr:MULTISPECIES: histidine kinase [unclassified Nocardioides]MDF9715761.1 hypothetical protein [Nocardioides sp. ChNu-99]MDN7121866.1 hypothetical protein [Nocardioides sp. ChNu-153]